MSDLVKSLAAIGITVSNPASASAEVWQELLATHKGSPLGQPALIAHTAILIAAPTLAEGCVVAGVVSSPVVFGVGCFLGPNGEVGGDEPTTFGDGCRISGTVASSTLGEGCQVSVASVVQSSTLGPRNRIGGEGGSGPEGAFVESSTLGEGNDVSGKLLRSAIGDGNVLDGHIEECDIAHRVFFRRSLAYRSLLGEGTKVLDNAYLEQATLLPYTQTIDGETKTHGVKVLRARVERSVIWGGTDLNDGVVVRRNSVIGPFVHLGAGSETKAALLRGATPESSFEAPHRSYLGNIMAVAFMAAGRREHFYADPGAAAREHRLAFNGPIDQRTIEAIPPEGYHEPEALAIGDATIQAEGINIGCLTTTSNFDPRAGGSKWPTLIGGGCKTGIMAKTQGPALLPEQGLLASGAKHGGDGAGRGALILGNAGGPGAVKDGFREQAASQLGADIPARVELTLLYLYNLEALIEALTPEIEAEDESHHRRGLTVERNLLSAQLEEIATYLLRYLDRAPLYWEKALGQAEKDPSLKESPKFKALQRFMEDLGGLRQRAGRFFEAPQAS